MDMQFAYEAPLKEPRLSSVVLGAMISTFDDTTVMNVESVVMFSDKERALG